MQKEYEKNPEGRLFVHLAEAYRRSGELEKARDLLVQGLVRHPDYLSARIVLAQVETELGNSDRAGEVWREVIDLDPDNELALWALAELEYNAGRTRESLVHYRRLTELGVDDTELDEMIALLEATLAERGASEGSRGRPAMGAPAAAGTAAAGNRESKVAGDREPQKPSPRKPIAEPAGAPADAGVRGGGVDAGSASGPQEPSAGRSDPRGSPDQVRQNGQETGGTALATTDAIGLSDLLVRLLEYRDATFHAGSSLTRLLAISIGRELELDRIHIEALALAALLSDLGALGLSAGNGRPLTDLKDSDERRNAEQREVAISLQLLQGITLPAGVHDAVRHQHERWDGKGYPDGLREEEIPYGARVIAIARACAAYLSRAAENGGVATALDELQRNAGSRYDPVVVSVLRRVFQRRADHGIGFGLGGRIVVLHPEELRGLGVATQLHAEGYEAEVLRDSSRARESLRRATPKAVIVGAELQADDLPRLIREIRSSPERAAIPIIVIDANDMDLRVRMLTSGADVCLASEISFREFKATLDALLRRREELEHPHDHGSSRVEARL
ncbi:MAG: HD domain-containing phosphohydrolase [Gemmatimonadota bacterium]